MTSALILAPVLVPSAELVGETLTPLVLPGATAPVEAYLQTLAPRSQETMRGCLKAIAKLVGAASPEVIPWAEWRYQHSAHVRAQLELLGPERHATANLHLAALRGVLLAARRLGVLSAEHYAGAIDMGRVKGSSLPSGRALSVDEVRLLFQGCDLSTPRGLQQALVVALLFGGGLRLSEPCGVALSDYNQKTGTLRVRGKGKKERDVALAEGARRAVAAWLTVRGDWPGPLLAPVLKNGAIQRRAIGPRALAKSLKLLAKRSGVAALRTHDFRRSYATALFSMQVDALLVRGLMGHASLETTMLYDYRPAQAMADASRRLHVPYPEKNEP